MGISAQLIVPVEMQQKVQEGTRDDIPAPGFDSGQLRHVFHVLPVISQ
jgi:hypothetical protein